MNPGPLYGVDRPILLQRAITLLKKGPLTFRITLISFLLRPARLE